ncbi:hypothetical protein [Streptomyces sp. M92]|uniref:hypothetical protein n=1 Tax=Streptomyces sp. M92 TaxID=2944250 RepID=UPI003FA74BB5
MEETQCKPDVRRAYTGRHVLLEPDGLIPAPLVDAAAYGTTWHRAREAALTLDELALELAQRPYDLRHAGVSFWLASGVECARRAGQSIQVLFRYYAKFLAEARHRANRLIEDSMRRWDERGDDAAAR